MVWFYCKFVSLERWRMSRWKRVNTGAKERVAGASQGNSGLILKRAGKFKADELEKGEIIAYKYGGRVIVHRINDLIKKDKTIIIYTKGDANNDVDGWKVTPDMIIGIVKNKIPAIGYPTIWLNERW